MCDLGPKNNFMLLFMMKKLGFGELKPTKMTLTLGDRSITSDWGVGRCSCQ